MKINVMWTVRTGLGSVIVPYLFIKAHAMKKKTKIPRDRGEKAVRKVWGRRFG
jgi:hypothetical protein